MSGTHEQLLLPGLGALAFLVAEDCPCPLRPPGLARHGRRTVARAKAIGPVLDLALEREGGRGPAGTVFRPDGDRAVEPRPQVSYDAS